jgi:ethanolamine utilization protein EutS
MRAMQQQGEPLTRIIQEYVPGKQVTIAHVIANPDRDLSSKIGLEQSEAIGIMTVTPGEAAIIAADIALKAASVEIGFVDRFSGTLVVSGDLSSVDVAVAAANEGLERILGFHPAPITRA